MGGTVMAIFSLILLMVIYGFGGIFLEQNELIIRPAFWAMYGLVFGIIAGIILGRV
jgi:hypothetical protein